MAQTQEPPSGADFSVLFVCTANLCRSPMAEHLLRVQLAPRELSWTVRSAGVQAHPGLPMHPSTARILKRNDIETSGWNSRFLDTDTIAAADVILTATELHRAAVARLQPGAMSRTFTLLEFAYLAQALPGMAEMSGDDFGPTLLDEATRVRGRIQPVARDRRDLADPIGQSFAKFRACAAVITGSLEEILRDRPRRAGTASPSRTTDRP